MMRHALRRGFSLLEVMVACGLLALVGSVLYTSLSSSIDAKEMVEGTSNRFHLARQAMSRMVDEVSMAYLSTHHNMSDPRTMTGFKGERDRMRFTAFGYTSRVEDDKRSESREVAYFLGTDDRTRSRALIRREQPNLDLELDEGGREQTLLPYVSELAFEYWDPLSEEWKENWDSEESAFLNRMPSRVRIVFVAKMDDEHAGLEQRFMTQARIWLGQPIRFER
jgi:general secretion pathway protein J